VYEVALTPFDPSRFYSSYRAYYFITFFNFLLNMVLALALGLAIERLFKHLGSSRAVAVRKYLRPKPDIVLVGIGILSCT
jgi:hypothetical protein